MLETQCVIHRYVRALFLTCYHCQWQLFIHLYYRIFLSLCLRLPLVHKWINNKDIERVICLLMHYVDDWNSRYLSSAFSWSDRRLLSTGRSIRETRYNLRSRGFYRNHAPKRKWGKWLRIRRGVDRTTRKITTNAFFYGYGYFLILFHVYLRFSHYLPSSHFLRSTPMQLNEKLRDDRSPLFHMAQLRIQSGSIFLASLSINSLAHDVRCKRIEQNHVCRSYAFFRRSIPSARCAE